MNRLKQQGQGFVARLMYVYGKKGEGDADRSSYV